MTPMARYRFLLFPTGWPSWLGPVGRIVNRWQMRYYRWKWPLR